MRYFFRFAMLTVAFALTTWGLLRWRDRAFSFDGFADFSAFPDLHPLYFLGVGLAIVPPTLWELFLLERRPADE